MSGGHLKLNYDWELAKVPLTYLETRNLQLLLHWAFLLLIALHITDVSSVHCRPLPPPTYEVFYTISEGVLQLRMVIILFNLKIPFLKMQTFQSVHI